MYLHQENVYKIAVLRTCVVVVSKGITEWHTLNLR
jgi:hypothetical protein